MIQEILDDIYSRLSEEQSGEVANYIPALAEADPKDFGLAIVTVNGDVYTAGDADTPFTIQSQSKPFTFALALEECGIETTYEHVGTEPSGDTFNSVVLDPVTKVPFNPMVNSGALSMAGLIQEKKGEGAFEAIRSCYSSFAGAELGVNDRVYDSELATAHRNRAIAHLLRSGEVVSDPVEEVVQLYTRQCSLEVTARQMATMAALLANIGTNPVTDETILSPLVVRHALSLMFTCGMYDYAGRWAVDVGIPAKSGVSGGLMAVVNRQIGIGLYSPPLDKHGNSVRAIKACVELAEEFGLHAFEFSNAGSSMLSVYIQDRLQNGIPVATQSPCPDPRLARPQEVRVSCPCATMGGLARLTITADVEGDITAVTGDVITILGYASNELLGRSIETIIPDKYSKAHKGGMSRYQATCTKTVLGSQLDIQALHKDGNEIEVTFCVTERQGTYEAILETSAADQFGFLGGGRLGGIA